MTRKRFSPKSRNALVVLGMHRSGTSALSGVLSRLGGDLPQTLLPANEYNEKGYYESLQLYQMNNAILSSGGAQWDDWQPFNPNWFDSHRAEEFLAKGADVLSDEFGTSRLFVLKDPRVCLIMPFWTRLFEQEKIQPTYVHIHRNPIAVAKSLNTRDGLPLQYGMLLWLRHVLDAENGSRGARRCFTRYDMLLENWGAVVANIKKQTGLVFPRDSDAVDAEIDAFLSADLNTSDKAVLNINDHHLLSDWAAKIYEVLQRWSEKGEDEKDFETLDTVRAELDATAPMFGKLIGETRRTARQHKDALEATKVELGKLRADTSAQNTELQFSIRGYENQTQEFMARITASEAATQAQVEETQALRAAHAKLQKKAARAKKENKGLLADLSTRIARMAELEEQNAQSTERADALAVQLSALQAQYDAQEQDHQKQAKAARLKQARLQTDFEKTLETALVARRKQSDQQIEQQRAQLEDVAAYNQALLDSTSWKITRPLRSLVLFFRPR